MRNGDYNLAVGAGWRLNLPYIMTDNNNVMIRLPNGSYYSTNQMDKESFEDVFGLYHNVKFENHNGEDFTLEVKVRRSLNPDIETSLITGDAMGLAGNLYEVYSATGNNFTVGGLINSAIAMSGWVILESKLTMKDGMEYIFNSFGGIKEIRDPSGENVIKFQYDENNRRLLNSIIDPYGNEIKIQYNNLSFLRPYITAIEKQDSSGNTAKWQYEYKSPELEGLMGVLPQLHKVTDPENRIFLYETDRSDSNVIISGGGSVKVNIFLTLLDLIPAVSALKEVMGVYSVTLTARFGMEWPQFINEITVPEKGTTQIEYYLADLSQFETKPADYFLGFIPTAVKFSYDFYQKLLTESVTVVNGELIKKITYDYDIKGYGSQHLVTRCVINDGNLITTNKYSTNSKSYYKHTFVEDTIVDLITAPLLMTEESNFEEAWYTRLSEMTIQKADGGVYETKTYSWDDEKSRLLSERSDRDAVISEISYEYDNWGNITKQVEKLSRKDSATGDRIKTTLTQYYGTDSAGIEDFPYTGVPETALNFVKNLPVAQSVNDGYLTVYNANAYDQYGRNIWSGIYNKDHWAATTTEYAGGEISRSVNPLGQVVNYSYSYNDGQINTKAVYEGKNITTESAKSIYTLSKLWEKDGNGNTTKYSYDKLNRVTKIEYPGSKIDLIVYDDEARTVTVKHEDGKVYEKYFYDDLHNLVKQELYDYSSGSEVVCTVALEYDRNNNVVKMTDANGNTTSYEYDQLNRLVKQTNPDGTKKTTEYYDNFAQRTIYDKNGNLTSERLSYDGLVEKQEKQNTNGIQRVVYEYDANGRMVETIDQLGQITKTSYSVFGEAEKVTKPSVTVYENKTDKTVTPVEIIEYNDMGLATVKKSGYENNYRVEENVYDSLGRAEKVKKYAVVNGTPSSEVRTVSYTYDANGNILTQTDEEGNVKTYTYTARNQKETETDPMGGLITYVYDRNDKVIKQTDAMGFVAEYKYDDLQRLVEARFPEVADGWAKREYSISYDHNGNALSMSEPGGKLTEWTYDSRNRKLTEKISGENCEIIERSWTYDKVGNITTLTEGGLETSYKYDCLNNLLETDFPDGQKEINEYDKLNRVTKITNAEGSYKTFDYNPLNLVTRQKDEDDKYIDFKYDVWGNQTWRNENNREGSGDQVWNITYNIFGEPVIEEKNDGTNWSYGYDKRGLIIRKTDPKGIMLTNTYDACGRLLSETRKLGGKTESKTYTYDANGFMYSASDNGVISKINFENGNYKANAYNLVTSLETLVAGKQLNTSYSYDDALNLTELSYPDKTKAAYTHNALGQLIAIKNGSGISYAENGTYDSHGRLLSLSAGNGKVTTRTWDYTAGTLAGYNWGLDDYISRSLEWNTLGNITSISKGTTAKSYTNTCLYDRVGRLKYEHNGAEAEVSTKESQKENFLYVQNDVSGKKKGVHSSEVVKLDYYAGSAIVDLEAVQKISSLTLFGKNDRISPEHLEIWLSEDGDTWTHDESVSWEKSSEGWKVIFEENAQASYVKLHSLWDERDEDYMPEDHATYKGNLWNLFEVSYIADGKENTFSYDARGNRISEIETYTGSNGRINEFEYYQNSDLIKKAGKWYFNYDKNGNLISRGTEAHTSGNELFSAWTFSDLEGELWTYEYDLQNRMTKASYSGKGSSNLKERGSYVYDYRGLLVKKTYQNYNPSDLVEVENEETAKPVTEFYEYTADGRVIYNERSEESNTTKTTYIWANTTLWCEINDGVVYYHHTDHLGTTEVITNESGTVVWEAGYEAFGSVLSERGDSSFTPSYTGKFFDKASGLYYFNARWYDSELGKFTTSDPIRDGLNWWNYCNGNPLSFVDWMGLEPKINDPKGTVMYAPGKNPYNYPKTFEEWSNNVKDFWIAQAKNTDLIPEGHTQVLVIRPNEGYGNDFDSLRVAIKNSPGKGIEVFSQTIGANAASLQFAKDNDGMTRPDGDYYYTTREPSGRPKNWALWKNSNGYNSNSYENVLREATDDHNIPVKTRYAINSGMYLSHANQKRNSSIEYSDGNTPWSAGCAITDGQAAENAYMDFINYHVNESGYVDNVRIKYISGVY